MIYDFTTQNESFINMSLLLEELGIQNNKFHLVLHNEKLMGVDPRDPALPAEIKMMVMEEAHNNFWYYFRELLRIPQAGSPTGGKFILSYSTISLLYLMYYNKNFIIIQSRQSGKTFIVNADIGRIFNFQNNTSIGSAGINIGMVNYAERSLLKNLEQIDNILNLLPDYLRFHKKVLNEKTMEYGDRKDRSSAQRVYENKANKNKIYTYVLGDSEDKASMAARGDSISTLSIDEMNFLKHNIKLIGSAIPATKTEMKNAALNGLPYGLRMMTTPDINTKHGRAIEELIDKSFIKWEPKYFDFSIEELNKTIKEHSDITSFDVFTVEYGYDELGYSNEWLSDARKNITAEQFKSEVLLIREGGSSLSPFTKETLVTYRTKLDDSFAYKAYFSWDANNEEEEFNNNDIQFTIYPEEGYLCNDDMDFKDFLKQYKDTGIILGIDPAQGTNNDNTAFVFINAKTTKMIASLYRDDININQTYVIVSKLIYEIIDPEMIKFIINTEATGIGLGLVQRFSKRSHIEKYLMIIPKEDNGNYGKDKDDQITKEFKIKGKMRKYHYGWKNTSSTRPLMIDVILDAVRYRHDAFLDEELYREACDLVSIKTSRSVRIEAAAGCHDDFLFAMGIALDPLINHSDILEAKFFFKVEPTEWLLTDGAVMVNPVTKRKSRIETFLKELNGVYYQEFYDTKTGVYVDKNTADKIMERESQISDIVDNKTIENSEKDIDELIRNRDINSTPEAVAGEFRPDLSNEEYFQQIGWNDNRNDNYSYDQENGFIDYWTLTNGDY